MHLDMNSYFASVEQQANPLLRGRPVGVCAYLSKNGCIIASSREAKAKGVKTGCRVGDAKMLCPDIILVENDPAKYISTTKRIFKIFGEYTASLEPYSIDEAFLDLTGHIHSYSEGETLIALIQRRMKVEVGEWLTCSAGLSWTRWLAKFAGDVAPKGGYRIIDSLCAARELYDSVSLTDAWGIGDRIADRLRALGIHSLRALQEYPVEHLMRMMGRYGYFLWANVNGIPVEDVHDAAEQLPKSIGHSYCVPKQTTDVRYIRSILMKLCEKTGRRLRARGLEGWGISAGYSTRDREHVFKQRRVYEPLYTSSDIFKTAYACIADVTPRNPVYMIAVSVTRLAPISGQQPLFHERARSRSLAGALDMVNDRYGEYTIVPGAMWGTYDQAPERIGYRKSVAITPPCDEMIRINEWE